MRCDSKYCTSVAFVYGEILGFESSNKFVLSTNHYASLFTFIKRLMSFVLD